MPRSDHPGYRQLPRKPKRDGYLYFPDGSRVRLGPGITHCVKCGGLLRLDRERGEKYCINPSCEKHPG